MTMTMTVCLVASAVANIDAILLAVAAHTNTITNETVYQTQALHRAIAYYRRPIGRDAKGGYLMVAPELDCAIRPECSRTLDWRER